MAQREALLIDTFVSLADTMVRDFDVVDFLSALADRCVQLFDADASGLMLADADGLLQLIASSSHEMRVLELLEIQDNQGPCPDAFVTGEAVECADLLVASTRWPTFAPAATALGFRSAHAVPLRLRTHVIGALNLLRSAPGSLTDEDRAAAQGLADVASIGLLQERAVREAALVTSQLEVALNSRIVIEQAKGVVAHTLDVDMDEAFRLLRRFSRNRNERLSAVAASVVDRRLDPGALSTS